MRIYRFVAGCALLLAVCGAISGCTQINRDQARTQTYSNDGYLGLVNSNPNLPTNPTFRTYKIDREAIHKAALTVPGVKDTRIYLGNATATVRLILDPGISPEQSDYIKAQAFQAITFSMPRYTVHVSVD